MFTTKCFIRKNTPELRKKLEELGYNYSTFDDLKLDGIVTFPGKDAYSVWADYHFNNMYALKSYIDCGENEDLFLALAALRDDTDKYQWFIYNSMDCTVEKLRNFYWFKCEEDKIEDMMYWDCAFLNCIKATVKELIEHFKK